MVETMVNKNALSLWDLCNYNDYDYLPSILIALIIMVFKKW